MRPLASYLDYILIFAFLIFLSACSFQQDQASAITTEDYRVIEENTIINLYDAFGEDHPEMQKDFGFSCILSYKGQIILFDAGSNADIFKNNIEALNIDPTTIDIAIASHAHFDHINGFDYLLEVNPEVKIYFPFDLFWGANIPFDLSGQDTTVVDSLEKKMQYFGGEYESYMFDQSGRFWNANVEFVKDNKEISPGVKLVTTASPNMGYFSQYPKIGIALEGDHVEEHQSSDAKLIGLNEISLSLETPDGEVVIVGCSHSTIEQIVKETIRYTENEISLAYGGYHLLPYDRPTLFDLSNRLKSELNVKRVAPAHCTGHLAFKILQDHYDENYLFAGLGEIVAF